MHRSSTPLSNERIAQFAPSVFAAEAHASRSDRYAYISTAQVLEGLRNEGFEPMAVGQTRCRDASKREFTKHLLRFRHRDSLQGGMVVGQEVPELVLVNSHDGASAYNLMGGIYRLVCSNGMIVGNTSSEVKVRHSGNVVGNVIEGSFEVIDSIKKVIPVIDDWKKLDLTYEQRKAYAEAALGLRWDADEAGNVQAPVSATSLLSARRFEDRGDSLWLTYQKTQENLIRGGLRGEGSTGRRMTTRAVSSVSENVKLNKALWQLTQRMAELAAA
jgi:hypothetical protein